MPAPTVGRGPGQPLVLRIGPSPRPDDPATTFVPEGSKRASPTAVAAAQGKDVVLFGGTVPRLALAHGPVDEVLVHLAPNLLGDGIRLFGSPGAGRNVGRRPLTDLRFRVGRPRPGPTPWAGSHA